MAFHEITKTQMKRFKEILAQAEEGHAYLEELAQEKRSEYDDKSDKYKEGDNATTADEWITMVEEARDFIESLKDKLAELPGISDD